MAARFLCLLLGFSCTAFANVEEEGSLIQLAGAANDDDGSPFPTELPEEDLMLQRDNQGFPRHLNEFAFHYKPGDAVAKAEGAKAFEKNCGGIYYEAYYYLEAPRTVRQLLQDANTGGKPIFRNQNGCSLYFNQQEEGPGQWAFTLDNAFTVSKNLTLGAKGTAPICGKYYLDRMGKATTGGHIMCGSHHPALVTWNLNSIKEHTREGRAPRLCQVASEKGERNQGEAYATSKEPVQEIVLKPGHMDKIMSFAFVDHQGNEHPGIAMQPGMRNTGALLLGHKAVQAYEQNTEISLMRREDTCVANINGKEAATWECPGEKLFAKVGIDGNAGCVWARVLQASPKATRATK